MKIIAASLLLLLVSGCTQPAPPATQPSTKITTGMPLQAALDAAKAVGGRETEMDLAPPQSKHGGFMTLKCFELAGGRLFYLVAT